MNSSHHINDEFTCKSSKALSSGKELITFDNKTESCLFTRMIFLNSSYYYRTAKTLEVIQRQRTHYKPLSKPPPTFLPIFHRSSSRLNLSENSTNITGDLTERNISLHDKSIGRNHSSLSIHDKQETKLPAINDNEFITEIPSSLELVLQNTTRKSNMERSLFEALKRQRSEHDRHRFLPINRAPYA